MDEGPRASTVVVGLAIRPRPAGADDIDRLIAWHADPEVSRYWDGETFTGAQLEERLARPDVEAWIVEEAGLPVGYMQVHWEASTCS